MKHHLRISTVLLAVYAACVDVLHAQTLPSNFNYQGRLTASAGTPLPWTNALLQVQMGTDTPIPRVA